MMTYDADGHMVWLDMFPVVQKEPDTSLLTQDSQVGGSSTEHNTAPAPAPATEMVVADGGSGSAADIPAAVSEPIAQQAIAVQEFAPTTAVVVAHKVVTGGDDSHTLHTLPATSVITSGPPLFVVAAACAL